MGPRPEVMSRLHPISEWPFTRTTQGEAIKIYQYVNLDAECRVGRYSVTVDQPPKHGSVVALDSTFANPRMVREALDARWDGKPDSRAHCQVGALPAKLFVYKPEAGYRGDDLVAIKVVDQKFVTTEFFRIQVRP